MRSRGKYATQRGNVREFFGPRNDLSAYLTAQGHLTDFSGNAKNGVGVNTLYLPTGDGIGFRSSEATPRYIKIGALGINLPSVPFTIMARVTPLDNTTYKRFASNGDGSAAHNAYFNIIARVSPTGAIQCLIEKAQIWTLLFNTRDGVVPPGRESIIACTWDGIGPNQKGMSVIVNGVKEANIQALSDIGTAPTAWDYWTIGAAYVADSTYTTAYSGEFISRDTAIFNRKLADREIIEYQRWAMDMARKNFFTTHTRRRKMEVAVC